MDQGNQVKHPKDPFDVDAEQLVSSPERKLIIDAVTEGNFAWEKIKKLIKRFWGKAKKKDYVINADRKHLLHLVAELGDTYLMELLLYEYKMCIVIDVGDSMGRTSLYYAIIAGQLAMVKYLLSEKADQFVKEPKTLYQPIHYAAQKGDEKMISLLLDEQGDKVNEIDQISKDGTPLEVAVKYRHVKAVELFLKNKYKDVSRQQKENALMQAIRSGCLDIVKLLVNYGVFSTNRRCSGETPLGLAASLGNLHIVKWLINHGKADSNVANKDGKLPLEVAVLRGDLNMASVFLRETTQVEPYTVWSVEGLLSSIASEKEKVVAQWSKRKKLLFKHHLALARKAGAGGEVPLINEEVWYHYYEAHKMFESDIDTLAYVCFCEMSASKCRGDDKVVADITTAYTEAGRQYSKKGQRELAAKAFKLSHELKERRIKIEAEKCSALPTENGQVDDAGTSDSSAINDNTQMGSSQILSIQERMKQLMTKQQVMLKQMAEIASILVTEGKRVETALGRNMEKAIKDNNDALWARMQEEFAKRDKIGRDHTHQMTSLIFKSVNEDLQVQLERILKKELATLGQTVAHLITPTVENAISSSIVEALQRGVGDKAVTQLEKSISANLEPAVGREILAEFQSSGRQAVQDALMSSLEASVIPAFEMSCRTFAEQVDRFFQKGLISHTTAVLESSHSPLAITLRDAINLATSLTQSLTELADGQRKLIARAAVGANSKAVNPLATQLSNEPMSGLHEMTMPMQQVETVPDPTKGLSRLITAQKFEVALLGVLLSSDVSNVSWFCSQVDLQGILLRDSSLLSQEVLLGLLQCLAEDIKKDTSQKLRWMRDVAVAIKPDPVLFAKYGFIFKGIYQSLAHHLTLPTNASSEFSSIHAVMVILNSLLQRAETNT